jgi:hypothetical protein
MHCNNRRVRVGLFDHLVGEREHCGRDGEAERLRRLEIDDELKFRRLLDGNVPLALRL